MIKGLFSSKYYLYRHIRLDKNEVFYVGIGTKCNKEENSNLYRVHYERACTKLGHNKIWNDIVNKNYDYEIEIIMESDNYQYLLTKEIEFIKLYGRIDLGTGTLANLTNGGEGCHGVKHSPEYKEKCRIRGLNMPKLVKDKISKTISKIQLIPIYQYGIKGEFIKEWKGIKIASVSLGISESNISQSANPKSSTITAGGFMWRKYKKDNLKFEVNKNWRNVKIYQYDMNYNLIDEFTSIKEADDKYNANRAIYDCIANKRKSFGGFYWLKVLKKNFK